MERGTIRVYQSDNPNNSLTIKAPLFVEVDDIIVLGNTAGAGGVGHQAVLIGNEKDGWIYISKDGAEESGAAMGKSRYTTKLYKTLDEFKDSVHNFETSVNHSLVGGGENPEASQNFKLDSKGNKIRRYDRAFRIKTEKKYDIQALKFIFNKAKEVYILGTSDCSHIVTTALNFSKNEKNNLKDGEKGAYFPMNKQKNIERLNIGEDYSNMLVPNSLKLKENEVGKKK